MPGKTYQTEPDQTRSDQTRSDQTGPDKTRPMCLQHPCYASCHHARHVSHAPHPLLPPHHPPHASFPATLACHFVAIGHTRARQALQMGMPHITCRWRHGVRGVSRCERWQRPGRKRCIFGIMTIHVTVEETWTPMWGCDLLQDATQDATQVLVGSFCMTYVHDASP